MCEKSSFPVSASRSYIGKSTIQQNSNRSSTVSPSSFPMTFRALPATASNFAGRPARKNAASPSPNPNWTRIPSVRSGPSALADRPRRLQRRRRLARQKIYPIPGSPSPWAKAFIRSQNARLPPPGAGIARTSFPACSSSPAKTLNPDPRNCSETICIFNGLRKSGLSDPYHSIASR